MEQKKVSLPDAVKNIIKIIDREDHETVKTVKSPNKMKLGYMYTYVYDPKHKKTLPFYDVLPMMVLLGKGGDRMIGLNLHYLPYTWRVKIAKNIMKLLSWKKRIKYSDVKKAINSAKVPEGLLYLCIRVYLYGKIQSNVKEFDSQNYELAIKNVMPQFKKETEENIYKILMSKFYKRIGGIRKKS